MNASQIESVRQKFTTTMREMNDSLIEREDETMLAMAAVVSGENLLFVGPPGTAKSMISDAMVEWIDGMRFPYHITKTTTDSEVFGQFSLKALKEQDVWRRNITGKLPEADVVFLDEVFNGSSAFLNSLLKVMNERVFVNGDTTINCHIKLLISASNLTHHDREDGKELAAFYDRFLLRKMVKPVQSREGKKRLRRAKGLKPSLSTRITSEEIDAVRKDAASLKIDEDISELMDKVFDTLELEGIFPSDRRQVKANEVVKAMAWLNGGTVTPECLEILSHVLWDEPTEQPAKVAEVVGKISNPSGYMVNEQMAAAQKIISAVDVRNEDATINAVGELRTIGKKLKDIGGAKSVRVLDWLTKEVTRIRTQALTVEE